MQDLRDTPALRAWDLDQRIPDAVIDRVLADPCFPLACRTLSARVLAAAADDVTFDGLAKDAGRWVSGMMAAYLHVTGGLTLPRLKALCSASGLLSPGRARAMLLYLQFLGYVRPAGAARGEPRRYAATPALMQALRRHAQAGLEAAALIDPVGARLAAQLEDPRVLEAFVRGQADGLLRSASQVDIDQPMIRLLYHRHAGVQLMHMILLAAPQDGAFPPLGYGPISTAAAARTLRVSRAHIMRVLADAERQGWLAHDPQGAIRFDGDARPWIRSYFALRLIGFLVCAAKAVLETRYASEVDPRLAPFMIPEPHPTNDRLAP